MKKTNKFYRDHSAQDTFGRVFELDLSRADESTGTIPVVISTEAPVSTFNGPEVLVHSKKAVDLSRAEKTGLPLIFSHDQREILGRVKNVVLRGKKLIGDLIFSKSDRGQGFFRDILDGIITDVSVGGEKHETAPLDGGGVRVTRWTPFEVSLVAIGADAGAGIARDANTDDVKEAEFIKRGQIMELNRRNTIRETFERHIKIDGVSVLLETCLTAGDTIERAKELLLDTLGKKTEPINQTPGQMFALGDDAKDKFALGINRALSIRVGVGTEDDAKDIGKNEFMSFSPVEMARHFLLLNGVQIGGLTRQAILGEAFVRGAIFGTATTSDFPNILADVANKALLKGYNETPETWNLWCMVGNLSDYKEALRPNLSEFDDLEYIPEAGEYGHGKFTDLAEKIKLLKFGRLFTITREALLNDDLSALGRIPQGMGRAAARKVGDLAYSVLIDNPVMNQDGIVLFHADHNNIGTPGAPSVETVDEARVLMGLQQGPAEAATLGIRPAFGICSLEVEGTFRTLMEAQYDPAASAGTLTPNSVKNAVVVVPEHRLSRDVPGAWYMAANGSVSDTVEVAFLDGNQAPYLEQQEAFTRDGVSHKVRIEAAAAPMDFRGMFFNAGA